jgi:hypothetical protein
MIYIFLPLEFFVWVEKDIIYQNIYSKLAKIAHRRRWPVKKIVENLIFLHQMLIKWL